MIDYTKAESAHFDQLLPDSSDLAALPRVAEYQEWAVQMQHYAAQVNNTQNKPDLVNAAHVLASDSSVIVFLRSSDNPPPSDSPPPSDNPPPWMDLYNYIGSDVDAAVDTLNNECPA